MIVPLSRAEAKMLYLSYMKFDKNILINIVKEKKYLQIYDFLTQKPDYSEILKKRISSFSI